jgi:hypothetical protein
MKCSDLIKEYKDPRTLRELKSQLSQAGYKSIGKGADAIVFAKKTDPNVIKVLIGEKDSHTDSAAKGFLAFVKFCRSLSSPHLPKFGEISQIQVGSEVMHQVILERLYNLTEDEKDVVWFMAQAVANHRPWESIMERIHSHGAEADAEYQAQVQAEKAKYLKIVQKHQDVFVVMQKLHDHANILKTVSMDLLNDEGQNIMKRKDGTWVITDPYVA